MKFPSEDWKWASVAAAGLTALAIVIAFGLKPGGFEGQTAWYFILLPFGLPASMFADFMTTPHATALVFWLLLTTLNFSWYCLIILAAIKVRRFLS